MKNFFFKPVIVRGERRRSFWFMNHVTGEIFKPYEIGKMFRTAIWLMKWDRQHKEVFG